MPFHTCSVHFVKVLLLMSSSWSGSSVLRDADLQLEVYKVGIAFFNLNFILVHLNNILLAEFHFCSGTSGHSDCGWV